MDKKINYAQIARITLQNADILHKKSLLLHACCGPCSCFPLLYLTPYYNVTIYYSNSNIYPSCEYEKRKENLLKLVTLFNQEYGTNVKVIFTSYNHEEYMKDLLPFGAEKEGRNRCFLCYEKRMREGFKYASENGYDYFTTTLTVSRQKSSSKINEIANAIESEYPNTKYFYSDFKKDQGIDIGQDLRRHFDLYQQEYCGCEFSMSSKK